MADSPARQLWTAVFGPGVVPCLREERVLQLLENMSDPRGQQVLQLRYWERKGWQEVADSLPRAGGGTGVSREVVRRIHVKALRRLRHPSRRPLWQEAVQEAVHGE